MNPRDTRINIYWSLLGSHNVVLRDACHAYQPASCQPTCPASHTGKALCVVHTLTLVIICFLFTFLNIFLLTCCATASLTICTHSDGEHCIWFSGCIWNKRDVGKRLTVSSLFRTINICIQTTFLIKLPVHCR